MAAVSVTNHSDWVIDNHPILPSRGEMPDGLSSTLVAKRLKLCILYYVCIPHDRDITNCNTSLNRRVATSQELEVLKYEVNFLIFILLKA